MIVPFIVLDGSWEYSWALEKYFFKNTFDNNIYYKNKFIFDKNIFGENIFDENIFGENVFDKNIFGENVFDENIFGQNIFGKREITFPPTLTPYYKPPTYNSHPLLPLIWS